MKICPLLVQNLTRETDKKQLHDDLRFGECPKVANCIRDNCMAFDYKTQTCKHYGTKVSM